MTTKDFLYSKLKQSGIRLNFLKKDDYDSQLLRPKIIGTPQQVEQFKFVFKEFKITWWEWVKIKVK